MRAPAARVPALFRTPMARGALALVVNTGLNAVLGFAFWVAAARLYPSAEVGVGSALISALLLVAGLGWMGLQYVLIRYLPTAGRAARRLVAASYAVAIAIGVTASTVLLLLPTAGDLGLTPTVTTALLFGGAASVWVVFSLQDAALIGLRRAAIVPVGNGAFGVLKLAGIVIVALAGTGGREADWGAEAIAVTWVLAAAATAVVMHGTVLLPAMRALDGPADLPTRRQLLRFGAAQHAAAVIAALPDWVVPLIVLSILGGVANARYYAAWTIAFAFRLVAVNLANAFTVQASLTVADRAAARSELLRLAPLAVIPLVALALFGADLLLGVFGADYGPGAAVLRWFGLGLVPFAVVTFLTAGHRVEGRSRSAVVVALITATATLALDLALVPRLGIEATGMAWAAAWTVAAVVVGGAAIVERGRRASLPAVTTKGPQP